MASSSCLIREPLGSDLGICVYPYTKNSAGYTEQATVVVVIVMAVVGVVFMVVVVVVVAVAVVLTWQLTLESWCQG